MQTALAEGLYQEAFARGIRPDPVMSVSEWADTYRVLDRRSSAEPGKWRTSRTPYLKEIMDCLSPSHPCQRVVVKKATQMGFTQAGMNWFGFIAHLAPGPCMMILPTDGAAKKHSKTKLNPMIQETAVLQGIIAEPKKKDSETTTLMKDFPGGYLMLVGANSSSAFRNVSIRYLMADDVNGYPLDLDEEGDALSLGIKRTGSFSNRKIYILSTTTVKGESRISKEFNESDQRYFFVPCPFCGSYQILRWGNIKFKHVEYALQGPVEYECEHCKKLISERFKSGMLEAGNWIAQNPKHTDAGFHLNAFYAPAGWTSWADIVKEFLQAKKAQDVQLLKTWTNTRLAEDWEEAGESVDEGSILARLEPFGKKVPAAACLLTCGVDIQKDRIEAEVTAWGPGEETWSQDYRVFEGTTDILSNPVWADLDKYLEQTWKHESGIEMQIGCTCVDSGDNTNTVYDFVKPRQYRRIFATKGSSQQGTPIITKLTRSKKVPVRLFMIGTDQAKEKILSRLKLVTPGPGYMHFPEGRSGEYFKQITAEELVTRFEHGHMRRIWKKRRPRNEALDIRVLNLAARAILGWDLDRLSKQFQEKAEKFKQIPENNMETAPRLQDENSPIKNQKKFIRKRQGFINKWR